MTTTTSPVHIGQRQAADHIAARVPFIASALSGRSTVPVGNSQLPVTYWAAFTTAAQAADFYVVLSYDTPIAWFADGVWSVPDKHYSVTTSSRHQSKLHLATPRHNGPGYRAAGAR